ncbi:MAG: hypothetical protein Q7T82_15405 [Armatimonadota bacterium]|nr:hypothetical protein [Armatimonadota bacterium]
MKNGFASLVALAIAGCSAAPTQLVRQSAQPKAQIEQSTHSSQASLSSGPTIEKPPTFKKGYKLTFRSRISDFDCTYEGVQDGLLVFHYDTRGKLPYDYLYTPDMKIAMFQTAQVQMRFEPPVGYLDFPLFVGKKWTTAYKGTSNSTHSMAESAVDVVAYEAVKVPYGTINAFRIRVRGSDREIGRANPYETYWYSPEVGYFIKHETNRPVYEDPYELVAFTK